VKKYIRGRQQYGECNTLLPELAATEVMKCDNNSVGLVVSFLLHGPEDFVRDSTRPTDKISCPRFSRTTAFSLSGQWSIDLSMISWSRFSQQVRALSLRSSRLEISMRCTFCCRASYSQLRAVGGHTDGCLRIFINHFTLYVNCLVHSNNKYHCVLITVERFHRTKQLC